jgi:hypothetical protein
VTITLEETKPDKKTKRHNIQEINDLSIIENLDSFVSCRQTSLGQSYTFPRPRFHTKTIATRPLEAIAR